MKNPITEIQIVPIKPTNGLVGFCSFVLFNSFYCGSIGIYTRPSGGYRLVYPTKKIGSRDLNIFHPISKEIGHQVEKSVNKKFKDVLKHDRYGCNYN